MNKRLLSTLVILALFFIPIVYAQAPAVSAFDQVRNGFSQVTGIPTEYLKFPELLYYLIIPTLAIIAITMAFLKEVTIFKKSPEVNFIISLTVGLIALSSEFTYKTASFLFTVMGVLSVFMFGAIFLIGLGLYSFNKFNIMHGTWFTWARKPALKYKQKQVDREIGKLSNLGPLTEEQRLKLERLKDQSSKLKAQQTLMQEKEDLAVQKRNEENQLNP